MASDLIKFVSSGGSWYKIATVKQQEEEWEVGKSLKKRISQVVVQVVSNKFLSQEKESQVPFLSSIFGKF